MSIAGIKFETDMHGQRRYVRIDLKRFGKNQLLEDFLDGIEAENRKNEETISLEDFKKQMDKRFKKDV